MPKTLFTSDTHLGHRKIIDHCKRPFPTVEAMDEALIAAWNSTVGPEDTVIHVGDFAYRNALSVGNYMDRLNGRELILVRGNHDTKDVCSHPRWSWICDLYDLKMGGRDIVHCHYPMRTWRSRGKGTIMLHGHTHGTIPMIRNSLDVGVDSMGMAPVTLDQILERLSTLEGTDAGD